MQYLVIRYTERLDAAGAVGSMGCKDDSQDNAAAEELIGLYKLDARQDQQLEEAFVGHFTDHHAFLLRTLPARIDQASADIAAVETKIEKLITLSPRPSGDSMRFPESTRPRHTP